MKKSILISTDEIQQYIRDIKKIPVISHERQNEIFSLLRENNLDKIEKKKLHDELIVGNLRFVISIAKLYQNQGLDIMDLISEGNIGLIKAAERFDPNMNVKFFSYAVWWVKQSILAALNEYSRTIRLPSNIVQESQKQRKKDSKNNELIGVMTDNEEQLSDLPFTISLYNEINQDGEQLIDTIVNDNADNPYDILNSTEEIKKKIRFMLNVLDEREKKIIEKSFGLTGVESSLEDLGEEFGCTKERIRQIRDKSLRKLRDNSYSLIKYLGK